MLRCGIGVDVIGQTSDLTGYRLVSGPMTYMLRPGFAEKVRAFVEAGGMYVSTYCSGWVNEEDLCFMGGFPGPLKDVLGVWDEETDALDETQRNHFTWQGKRYETKDFCALIHPEGAKALSEYEDCFYRGYPVLTENTFGKGKAYYIAARTGMDFLTDFYHTAIRQAGIAPLIPELPRGFLYAERAGDKGRFLFVMNTVPRENTVCLPDCRDAETAPFGHTESQFHLPPLVYSAWRTSRCCWRR